MNLRLTSVCALAAALSVSASIPLSAEETLPKPVMQAAPAYSAQLRRALMEGDVTVYFTITPAGTVANATVVHSTQRVLEQPTLDAVRKWKFTPAIKDGHAVSVQVQQVVAFTIPELHEKASSVMVAAIQPRQDAASKN